MLNERMKELFVAMIDDVGSWSGFKLHQWIRNLLEIGFTKEEILELKITKDCTPESIDQVQKDINDGVDYY